MLIFETHLIIEAQKVLAMYVVEYLKKLALLGAIDKPIKISSSEFTKYTSSSSKTAARILKQLENEHFIDRKIIPGGQLVTISEGGVKRLRAEYADYRYIFGKDEESIEMYGYLISGLGEGQYYIGLEGYRSQFQENLNFVPFPGTFNVQLTDFSVNMREKVDMIHAIPISGFTDGQRTFGAVKCYSAQIEGIRSAVVVPDRSHYPDDLVEIIAPVNLRKTLGLEDGDKVKIVVDYRYTSK